MEKERLIVLATGNEGKVREFREILKDLDARLVSLADLSIRADVEETGTTFEENALIKARAIQSQTGEIAMADDSGLEVDFLGGAPGVRSARFLGEDTSYRVKNAHILRELSGASEEERGARYVCVIACVFPDGETLLSRGTVEGRIGREERGGNGFGYDPIFFVPELGRTMAELSMEEKNRISHRGKALEEMRRMLREKGL